MTDTAWTTAATRLVRTELDRANFTYAELAERLRAIGLQETESSVKNKLHRGTFSAVFLLQCMNVLNRASVDIPSLLPRGDESS